METKGLAVTTFIIAAAFITTGNLAAQWYALRYE
jgi:hypothetical protein